MVIQKNSGGKALLKTFFCGPLVLFQVGQNLTPILLIRQFLFFLKQGRLCMAAVTFFSLY